MLRGDPTETVPKLVKDTGAALLVTDFGPLRLGREWRSKVRSRPRPDRCNTTLCSWCSPAGVTERQRDDAFARPRQAHHVWLLFTVPLALSATNSLSSMVQPLSWGCLQVADAVSVPFHEVDAHNVVPCWHASDKRETGARTIRGKINKQVPEFLEVSARPLSVRIVAWSLQQMTVRALARSQVCELAWS